MQGTEYIEKYKSGLTDYWNQISTQLITWKNAYEWPKGVFIDDALRIRNELEKKIWSELKQQGYLSKQTFNDVIIWGFNHPSKLTETDIAKATKEAFRYLQQDNIEYAALSLVKLKGIGISRASKILGLSNQNDIGIYDSRAADGLSDLVIGNKRLVTIPPGKVVSGNTLPNTYFCVEYQKYIWILRFFRNLAQQDKDIAPYFRRVSDLEIAFFSRSRNQYMILKNMKREVPTIKSDIDGDSDTYMTLGYGDKAKKFRAIVDKNGITFFTGQDGRTQCFLLSKDIEQCISYFKDKGWFLLGNNITDIKPGGLGEYFKNVLKVGAKLASNFAAVMVRQGRLEYKYGEYNSLNLKVK
ncbi:MAG: hypothetical protein FIA99_04250 [Ruminiclostridium sp.]|nr:hypothetical protein [Ruminiclostridium sp.]